MNIAMTGHLTIRTWASVWRRMRELVEGSDQDVSIDIDGVSRVDGLTLNLLAATWRLLHERGRQLHVLSHDATQRMLLHRVGLDSYVDLVA